MNRIAQPYVAFSILILSCGSAFSQSAIEKYGDPVENVPNVVSFDCYFEPGSEPDSVSALGTKMWIPNEFELEEDEDTWLYRNVLVQGDNDETFEIPLAGIHLGDYKVGSFSSFFGEFQTIAGPETNYLGATVIQRLPKPEDSDPRIWLFMLKDSHFLKIVSFDPIDWASLLACFRS